VSQEIRPKYCEDFKDLSAQRDRKFKDCYTATKKHEQITIQTLHKSCSHNKIISLVYLVPYHPKWFSPRQHEFKSPQSADFFSVSVAHWLQTIMSDESSHKLRIFDEYTESGHET
jgi:hypothetical protein